MANYDPPYGYDYNSIMQQPGRSDSTFQSILGLLNNYPMHNSLAYSSIFGGGKKWEGHPKNFKQPVQNLQSTWGLLRETPLNKFESAATDNAIQSLGNLIGGEGGTNPLGADKATEKLSGFMKGDTTSAGSQGKGKGSGLSNDPGAYINSAKDLVSWGMDIADSATSKMSLPSQPKYHSENVHNVYSYDRLRKSPEASLSWAGKKPEGLESTIDIFGKTASGAMDGLSIGGPWGALAGAVVGMGMGVGNAIAKGVTYNRNLKAINNFNRTNDRNFIIAQRNAYSNLDAANNTSMYRQRILGNYGAFGGAMLPRYSANAYGLGGTVEPHELMGVTTFNAGGTHETNPNGGVMIGIGENGKPNLVEEGEVRWNDFIFSKRVKPTEDVLRKYNTFMKGGFASYADMANKIIEMHKEREDSPFDKAAMNIQMQRLADAQEWEKLAEEAAKYGLTPEQYNQYLMESENQRQNVSAYGGNLYGNGGGVYYDPKTRTIVRLDSEPEDPRFVRIDDYDKSGKNYKGHYNGQSDFYNQLWNSMPEDEKQAFINSTYDFYNSDAYVPANPYSKWSVANTDFYNQATNGLWGSVHQAWIDKLYERWLAQQAEEPQQAPETKTASVTTTSEDTPVPQQSQQGPVERTDVVDGKKQPYPYYADLLRYAPAFNNLAAILEQNAPDYTYANQLASLYRPASYRPVGMYQRYQPIDQHYNDTMANHQLNTLYGLYRNNAQSNAAANYYAALAATQGGSQAARAYSDSIAQNNNARNAVLAYNNTVDSANETARRQTEQTNNANYANLMSRAYAAAEEERLAVENARETNKMHFAENLGNIGRELYDRWRVNNNPAYSYDTRWRYTGNIPIMEIPMSDYEKYMEWMKKNNG